MDTLHFVTFTKETKIMTKIPSSLLSLTTLLLHVFILPVFFLSFILIYDSQWMTEFLDAGLGTIFNTLMLSCILIGVMAISRLRLSFSTLPYIYIIMALLYALIYPDEEEAAEEDLVRFTDSTGRLKLVIAHDVLLYIEARENYVSIHYLEGEKLKEYSLRQTMRGIEDLMTKHGIIRCQRSYFVNPRHVTVLRRDKEGFIQAELDSTNKPVPVSPKYYEQLSKML